MKSYLRCLGLAIIGFLIAAVAFVFIADPYRLYGIGPYDFNAVKPRPQRYQSQIKLHAAMVRDSDALILGNSRADIGFDPENPVFAARKLNAYNLAVPGTSAIDSARQLSRFLQTGRRPKVIVMGAEFLDFLEDPEALGPLPDLQQQPVGQWYWRANAIFSFESLDDAWRTLRIQKDPHAEVMSERGFNPLLEYNRIAETEGYHAMFAQRAQENAKILARKPRALRQRASGTSGQVEALRAIYRSSAEEGIELHIIIYPYHSQLMKMFDDFGLSSLFDEWKTMLVEEAQKISERYPSASIRIWDFSGYAGPRCEHIPQKADRSSRMRWYWEGGHFKSALGDVILKEVFADSPSLGLKLDKSSLKQNRERLGREKTQCNREYPELFTAQSG